MSDSDQPEPPREGFDLKRNYNRHKLDLFTVYRSYLLLFCLSAVADAASTKFFMERVGPQVEWNFYVRTLSVLYGSTAGPLLGKLYQLFALWAFSILTPRLTKFVCLMIIAINFSAAIVNFGTYKNRPTKAPQNPRGPNPVQNVSSPDYVGNGAGIYVAETRLV